MSGPNRGCGWPRILLHADMDAFYAAVEQRDDPALRGKPVIVGGPGHRGVVTTASYEARPYGVGSAMPMSRALRNCPHAIVVPPRFEHYKAVSDQIMATFRDFSPVVEALSLDEAFLEMTGAEGLFGPPEQMGRALKAAVRAATELTVSVGIASTKFLAKVASDEQKPDGLTIVPPDRALAFLHPLPVKRLWGVGPKTEAILDQLGLRLVGDVAKADPHWLERELGSLGRHLHRLAHNHDPRPVVSRRRAKSVGAELTLGRDVRGAEAIKPHLLSCADKVARRLRKKGMRAGGLRVKLKTHRFELHSRQRLLAEPTDHADTLYAFALELLERFDLDPPMRLVGIAAFAIVEPGEPVQAELFNQSVVVAESQLDRAIDALAGKFGRGTVGRASDGARGNRGVTIGEVSDD